MTADEIEKYGDVLFDRIEGFQDEVLKTIGRRIKQIGSLSAYDSQTLKNLADITGDMKAITSLLAEVTGMNIKDIQKVYAGVLTDTAEKYKPLYDFRNMSFVPFSQSEFGQNLLKHWAEQTAGDMINLSRTKAIGFTDESGAFKSIAGAYQAAVDKAVFNISTGTEDFNTAMRQTVEALGGSGVKTLYKGINKNGVPYTLNVGLDSMIRANLLYGAKQAAQAYDEHIGEELGCDGFEVDAHSNPRPAHEFMQGKIYSYSGKKEIDGVTYEDGAAALSALEDYGCLHFKTDVILGVSEPRYGKKHLDKLHKENTELIDYNGVKKTGYEWKQQQRALERAVRREKGIISIAEASGDKTLVKRSKERIAAYKARYNDMCNKVGLQKTPERMATSYKDLTRRKVNDIIPVVLPDGSMSNVTVGTQIKNIEVFAGKGSGKDLRVKNFLVENYGGTADNWQHTKGRGFVDVDNESRKAMLHWFEESNVGIREMKVKGWSKK